MGDSTMLERALELAELGLRVFPLNGKTPIGGHGCLDATTDPLQIESWWERYPKANIGLATGKGIAVLDVDVRRDGGSSLKNLVHGHKEDFRTVSAKSGGGGRHFFFGVTKNMWVPNSKDRIGRGLELLYDGRYVVAPPSIHPITGNTYEWVRAPDEADCLQMPSWLAELNVKESGTHSWDKYAEEIKEGEGRNNHLAAYAGSLRRGGATVMEIYDALIARNTRVCSPPLSTRDVMTIARSISRYKPEDVMITAKFDDAGNGERLASIVAGHALFVPGVGWHTWSGRRWRPDEEGLLIQRHAKRVRTELRYAAEDVERKAPELAKNLRGWAHRCGSWGTITAMIKAAADEDKILTGVSKLDRSPYYINTLNGTFDLKKNKLLEHDSTHLLTKMARVEYDPDAECPQWNRFLEQVLPNSAVRHYVQRAVGYSMTGSVDEQCFFLMYGIGSNGKSTFIETLKYMLGHYAWKMATDTVMGGYRATGAATPDLVMLRGPRLVVAAETGSGGRLNEAAIKDLTGKDTMHARALYKGPIEFTPQFKLWMYSNYKPIIKGMDYGIWRRIRLIPFTAVIRKPDKNLSDKLKIEMPGIFNWALRGFQEWEKYGLNEPKAIKAEVAEYQEDMDIVGQFIGDKCVVGERHAESAEELWDAFGVWQRDLPKGEQIGRRTFHERLSGLGYQKCKKRINGSKWQVRGFEGLRLRTR